MIRLERPECPNPTALAKRNYKASANKEALRKSTSGKCMYCEGKSGHVSHPHVEHIKPKSKFPELEFEWDNLGFCCAVCNNNKNDKYDESTPFINPYDEDPARHIVFAGYIIFTMHGSERGEFTIRKLKLNRIELVEDREEKMKGVISMINEAYRTSNAYLRNATIEEIKKMAEKDQEYSAMVKSFLVAQKIITT